MKRKYIFIETFAIMVPLGTFESSFFTDRLPRWTL